MNLWNTGRFSINADNLVTPTDRLLVCGVKKPQIARGSRSVLAPGGEYDADLAEAGPVAADRPSAIIAMLIFVVGVALGFEVMSTWPWPF